MSGEAAEGAYVICGMAYMLLVCAPALALMLSGREIDLSVMVCSRKGMSALRLRSFETELAWVSVCGFLRLHAYTSGTAHCMAGQPRRGMVRLLVGDGRDGVRGGSDGLCSGVQKENARRSGYCGERVYRLILGVPDGYHCASAESLRTERLRFLRACLCEAWNTKHRDRQLNCPWIRH